MGEAYNWVVSICLKSDVLVNAKPQTEIKWDPISALSLPVPPPGQRAWQCLKFLNIDVKARIGHRRPNRLVDSSQTQSSILSSILPIRFTSIFSEPMKRPTTTTTTTITTAVVAPFGDEKKNPFEDGRSPESAQMEASAPSKAEAEAEALSPSAEEEELRRHRRRRRLYKETSTAKDITKTSTPSLIWSIRCIATFCWQRRRRQWRRWRGKRPNRICEDRLRSKSMIENFPGNSPRRRREAAVLRAASGTRPLTKLFQTFSLEFTVARECRSDMFWR